MPTRGVVIDGSRRAEFDGVEVVRGTTIAREGDCGRLILPHEIALNLGLI